MFWTVHWMDFAAVNAIEEFEEEVNDHEYIEEYNKYIDAWNSFVNICENSDVARCWVTVHDNPKDMNGKIVLAYTNRWEDDIILQFE